VATEHLDELARRVLDGEDIDWDTEASLAPPEARAVVAELRVLDLMAAVHRELPAGAPPATWSPAIFAGDAELVAPGEWAHLKVLECIGKGSTGVVFRAWDTRLDREVALKILRAEPSAAPEGASIIHEGRLLARVRHPNVVTIHGAEQKGGWIGLWMEFVRGRSFEDLLRARGPLDPATVVSAGIEMCRAVAAVHAAGLLHRDIKAQNVMCADDGRVLLMDFGAGRPLDDASPSDLTGTPLYLAPEIFAGRQASPASDVYSVGVLLDHLLTGTYPVAGRTVRDVRCAHARNDRRDLAAARRDLPAALVAVIARATAPDPTRRHADAAALGRELEAIHRSFAPRRGRARRRWAAGALAAGVLAAAGWWAATTGVGTGPAPAVAATTIAVLPLTTPGAPAGNTEFADGLTAEIVRELSAIDGLAARSAVAISRGARSRAGVRASLGVEYVVEGSVERTADRVRASIRLSRVEDNVTAWADVLERGDDNAAPIQREIAWAIAEALQLSVGPAAAGHQLPFESNYLFVRARGLLIRRSPESVAQAIELYDHVVARNPEYAPGWAALATATATLSRRDAAEIMPPPDPRTKPAALRAVELDPSLPEAHAALGNAAARDRDWARSEAAFERALELGPSLTTVHTDYVLSTLLPLGRLEDALECLRAARAADPLSLDVRRVTALVEVDSGRYTDAIASAQWVLERDPAFPYADTWLGRALALSGRYEDALAVLGRNAGNWGYSGYVLAVSGRRAEAEALAAAHPESPSRQMLIYGGLGDKERALDALERAAQANWWRGATWMRRPEVAVLQGDPRLAALAARMGLPQ
jgi:serine/threonine protein kinase